MKDLRILLLEPNAAAKKLETIMLSKIPGVKEVLAMPNGIAGLKILYEDYGISLIVSCVHMPLMNGFELIRNLADSGMLSIPVIMISNDISMHEQVMQAGAYEFLTKPLSQDRLAEAIERAASMLL
ncbi:response regulator receiver domain-containing protein [Candidatus Campylobacter infans]|uniref:Response regulator receiver domain-containing protein n=1 Tax=Candidatus Campylobacter infans TaxID=2561898 RepID=A0A7H9CHV1_9BACT|nr:response regulator [Candidatus Campylobacter infans]KAF0590751.1 MAG: response regulator receiver domain-containing protein [Candidatus Campylobacter infans]QLI04828.1 response regulator receiver domain-containing protein [Candidatus Campylobacter infans]